MSKRSFPQIDLDSNDLFEKAVPFLAPEMIKRLMAYGICELVPKSATLFKRGVRGADLFVVLEGQLELYEEKEGGRCAVISTLTDRQFTGELDLLSDRQVLLSCRAIRQTSVLRILRQDLQRMMRTELDIADLIVASWMRRRAGLVREEKGGVILLGHARNPDTLRLQQFMGRNGHPYKFVDADVHEDAELLLSSLNLRPEEMPVVFLPARRVLRNPSVAFLADELGLSEMVDATEPFDVAIVGAGPAGLAAAVYAASEGLRTVLIEGIAPGGQAGTSSHIENYLGFPTGISGQELAQRAEIQARKFGAYIAVSRDVSSMSLSDGIHTLRLADGSSICANAVVIASGASYRKLELSQLADSEYERIHYAATPVEATRCSGREVIVVGGGNSAGQAALHLAVTASHVHLVVRGLGLGLTMSDYLVQRIGLSSRISLHTCTEVESCQECRTSSSVTLVNRETGERSTRVVAAIFAMIGAKPNTSWLENHVQLDRHGFVVTGVSASDGDMHFATSRKGVFAVGDVRSGYVKRAASAVGEGSAVISEVHRYLASTSVPQDAVGEARNGTSLPNVSNIRVESNYLHGASQSGQALGWAS